MVLGSLKETLTGTLTDDEDEEEERQPFVSATERLVSDKVRRGGRQPFVSATERLASQKIDMDTAEGLMKVAMASGDPEVIEKAKDITNANDSLLKQIGDTFKVSLTGFLDVIQRPNYAIASAVKNIIDKKPETTVLAGFKSGITGETKHTFADVFEEAGWNPETRAEKITRSVAGFTADVLLDPTTYVTFGVGSGIKVVTMTGKKVMTKEGAEFFGKAMARRKSAAVSAKAFTKAERKEVKNLIAQAVPRNIANETISSQKALQLTAEELGDKFVKESMVKMAETSPELSNKFFQQGGLKFFGKTLISGGRINTVIKTVPGISKFDDLTKPTRDSLGALFDRNVSAKFGRLPEEFADLYQKFIDISRTKSEDAVNHVIDIARSNNLTYQEAEIIANAIENGTHLADARLENASKLFQRVLGRDLKKELKAGIKKAELPNFVPHMLVDAEVSKRAFKAPPASKLPTGKTPGSAKERKIIRFVSEAGDEAPIGKAESLGLRKVNSKKMIQAVEKRTKETTVKLQKTQRKLAKPEIDLKTSDLRSLISDLRKQLTQTNNVVKLIDEPTTKQLKTAINSAVGLERRELKKLIADLEARVATSGGDEFVTKVAGKKATREAKIVDLEKQIKKVQNAAIEKQRKLQFFDYVDKNGRFFKGLKGSETFKGRGQATIKDINDAFGKDFFDSNIIRTTAYSSLASARAVTKRDFLREAAQKFGTATNSAPSNYVEVGIKELEGFKFHPAIAEAMTSMDKQFLDDAATNKLFRVFDRAQSLWKASVTSIFPAFHGRNAISNVFQSYLDIGKHAISLTKNAMSTNLLNKQRKFKQFEQMSLMSGEQGARGRALLRQLSDEKVLTDINGKDWNFGELQRVMRDNRVSFQGDYLAMFDMDKTISQRLKQTEDIGSKAKQLASLSNPLSTQNVVFKAGRKTTQVIEEQARMVNFLTNLEKSGDVATAAGRTKQFLFDYQNLSNFERNVMRRLIPFYTFTRKNLELQATQFVKQPGKYATTAKGFRTITNVMSGAELTAEEKENLPEFLREGLGIIVKKDGNNVEIVRSLGTPVEQVFEAVQKNVILGGVSPIIAVPLQLAVNRNFFKDKPLDEDDNAAAFRHAPDFIKSYIGFTEKELPDGTKRYVALNPMRKFVIENLPPTARVQSSIRQLTTENVSGRLKFLQAMTGIKPYETNLDQNQAIRERTQFRELQEVLDKAGIAPTFKKTFIPQGEEDFEQRAARMK